MQPSPLANPLATIAQLEASSSSLDGILPDLEDSVRYAGAKLTQAAGILLRLPQEVVAQAIVVFMRFWVGPEGGSLGEVGAEVTMHLFTTICSRLPLVLLTPRSKFPPPRSTSLPSYPHTRSPRAVS